MMVDKLSLRSAVLWSVIVLLLILLFVVALVLYLSQRRVEGEAFFAQTTTRTPFDQPGRLFSEQQPQFRVGESTLEGIVSSANRDGFIRAMVENSVFAVFAGSSQSLVKSAERKEMWDAYREFL